MSTPFYEYPLTDSQDQPKEVTHIPTEGDTNYDQITKLK